MNEGSEPAVDYIRVYLRDCTIQLNVGVHAYEKPKPQPVIVYAEVTSLLPRRYDNVAENSLDLIMDYDKLYQFVYKELPKMQHIAFLETIAEQIITFCFKDPRVAEVRVRLEKPEIFAGTARAGIEMFRKRMSA